MKTKLKIFYLRIRKSASLNIHKLIKFMEIYQLETHIWLKKGVFWIYKICYTELKKKESNINSEKPKKHVYTVNMDIDFKLAS